MKKIAMLVSSVAAVVFLAASAAAESTRSYGTVDSFGILRWERFSINPKVGKIVTLLTKDNPSESDLLEAGRAVAEAPGDIPSRALRAELRIRCDHFTKKYKRWTHEELSKMNSADRFEMCYILYHQRRLRFPERYGITSDLQKVTPPYSEFNVDDLLYLDIQEATQGLTVGEKFLRLDRDMRFWNIESARREARQLVSAFPDLWEAEALQAFAFRPGTPNKMWNPQKGRFDAANVSPDYVRRPDLAFKLADELIRKHSECRVLYQLAGVAALDQGKENVAISNFNAYIALPDPESRAYDELGMFVSYSRG